MNSKETLKQIWDTINPDDEYDYFIIELMAERRGRDRVAFFQEFSKRFLKTDSLVEVAQTALQVDSPLGLAQTALQASSPTEAAQKMLQVDSPMGLAQKALQDYSPEEAALSFIQNEEQVNRLLELIRQRNMKAGESDSSDVTT